MVVLNILGLIALVAAFVVLFQAAVLFAEVLASLLPGKQASPLQRAPGTIAVLVPAHDEAGGIAPILETIRRELLPTDRLIVVADNCTDATAQIARQAGAEVIERQNVALRGKGYALDFGIKHLAQNPPDIVMIIDADCTPAPGSVAKLAAMAAYHGRPAQGLYLLEQPAGTLTQYLKVALIAWKLKLLVRPLGLRKIDGPCGLFGTGMAFPWAVMSKLDLHTGNIVEDIALGLECAQRGHAPIFCREALFTSPFPISTDAQQTQRTRWETGHLNMIAQRVPKLLYEAIRTGNRDLLIMACDIAVPPVAFLGMTIIGIATASLLVAALGGPMLAFAVAGAAGVVFASAILFAWPQIGKGTMTLVELGLVPAYAVSKLLMYARIVSGRQVEWIRSKRD